MSHHSCNFAASEPDTASSITTIVNALPTIVRDVIALIPHPVPHSNDNLSTAVNRQNLTCNTLQILRVFLIGLFITSNSELLANN